jgi:hypothetical protein
VVNKKAEILVFRVQSLGPFSQILLVKGFAFFGRKTPDRNKVELPNSIAPSRK